MSDLWSLCRIGQLSLKNRLVMPPMALDIAGANGEVTPGTLGHYAARAQLYCGRESLPEQGLGLIIAEHCYVSREGRAHPRQLGIYEDRLIPGLAQLAETIHRGGAAAGIQLNFAGARGLDYVCGPSDIPVPFLKRFKKNRIGYLFKKPENDIPKELNPAEIKKITADFARAALRGKTAGFDLVEIHGAHGYLLNQFFSPLTNQRKDEFGGNLHNRLRFSLQVLAAVRTEVGPDFPVLYRLGADDRLTGGNGIEDGIMAAKILEAAGVDGLDLSGGLGGYIKEGPEGFFNYLGDAIKPNINIPVLVTGGIKTGTFANQVIVEGHADLVGVGRAILAKPEWVCQAWDETHS